MILHLDMDAFFASVELSDNPGLRGKPVIVGGGERGVVSTASYEARRFGIHSSMPLATARRLCPEGVFLHVRHERYAEVSARVMAALSDFSPTVERASVDEAYLDAEGLERLFGPPENLARIIKDRVAEVTGGLTCSVGVAPVKFLAKICSEVNKPDGIFVLRPEEADAFLLDLQVMRIPGVGERMAAELAKLGVARVRELRALGPDFLGRRFGKAGAVLYERACGRDPRKVVPEREAKSEGAEHTFGRDTWDRDILVKSLLRHAERVGERLRKNGFRGRTVTLKVKFADFRQITRSRTLGWRTDCTMTIFDTARKLLDEEPLQEAVRLIGLSVSGFRGQAEQMFLPVAGNGARTIPTEEEREARLDRAIDTLRARYGRDIVRRGM